MDMASVAVEMLLNQAFSVLTADHKFTSNVDNFKQDLLSLVENVKTLQGFLLDAKNLETEAVKGWLQMVESIATEADDLLEEYAYEVLRQNIEASKEEDSEVSQHVFLSILGEIVVDKLKEINLSLERICQESANIGLTQIIKNGSEQHEVGLIGGYAYEREILGRENDVMKLTDMLINYDDQKDFSVLSIVGIGGQGKTTLALLVYENPVVVSHFDHRIWVTISEDFDVVRIFREMAESIIGYDIFKKKSKEAMMRHLKVVLKCRRYLIVCDDACDANRTVWESVEKEFLEISSSRGSKMMVLTRSQEVPEIMKASLYYHLEGLSNEDSWKLFEKRVFGRGRKETAELGDTGKRMVENCRGVPLAIELLSALLYSRKDEEHWSIISAKWASASDADVVVEAIRLSFDNLSSESLKQCFMYCSLLPNNCLMEIENLIQIWMAQGLLNSSSNEHTLEATGDLYFDILMETSLLGEPIYDEFSNVEACKMHGLVHDFALHISRDYCSNMKLRYASDNREVEVLSVNYVMNPQRLRALYLVGGNFGNTFMTNMRRLHVLILDDRNIKELPSSIGELKYLRYLDISSTSINTFPDSIMKLYNLQTLKVSGVKALPKNFIILKNMRPVYSNLNIYRIGELDNIRTITMNNSIHNLDKGFAMKELATLDNLRGKLIIYAIQNVICKDEESRSKLSSKFGISNLELSWSYILKDERNSTEVLEGLKPQSNLRILGIIGFNGYKLPSWMTSNNHVHMCNLVRIHLEDCEQSEELPTLGHLPNLQVIEIYWMNNVKCIGSEFYGLNELGSTTAVFPSLRKLRLGMQNLEKWLGVRNSSVSSHRIGFPRLENLVLDFCRSLTDMPEIDCYNSLSHLSTSHCHKLTSLPDWFKGLVYMKEFTLIDSSVNYLPEMICLVSLQRMSIRSCDSMVHLPDLSCLTSLQKLVISSCSNLESISRVPGSLESLDIDYCFRLKALPELSDVSALQQLRICFCSNIVSIPNVPNGLRSLSITNCYRLKASPVGIEGCNFLEKVWITSCSSLESVDGLQHLSHLKRLEVGGFLESLDHFPYQIESSFQYLESLKLVGWSSLKSLPNLQRLPALRELIIDNFHNLEALPECLGDFELLKFLYLSCSDNLKYLPSAEALRNLHYLQDLSIWECPLLKERCNGSGPEWHKISRFNFQWLLVNCIVQLVDALNSVTGRLALLIFLNL